MSRNNVSQFGREDSFDWVNRKLAQTLGLGVAASPLRRDRPLDQLPEVEVKNFSNLLKSRLSRVADPKTGQIHYEMVQGGSDFIGDGQDPELVSIAENYLPILRRAIRSMRGADCCDDDLAAQLGAADIAIEDLNEELRDAPCKVVIDRILNVLGIHIGEIIDLVEGGSPELIQRASNASNVFGNLQPLISNRTTMSGTSIVQNSVDWWNYVVRRPMALSHEVVELQRMLSALGITREQLRGQNFAKGITNPNSSPALWDWSMWDFLQAAQDFPKLWIKEADAKRDDDTAKRIADSVRELHDVFDAPLNPKSSSPSIEKICEELGLLTEECCDEGRMVMARLTRFTKLGVTILAPLAAPLTSPPITPSAVPSGGSGVATNSGSPPTVFGPHRPTFHGRPEETQPISIIYPRMQDQPRPDAGTGILIGNLFGVVADEQPNEEQLLNVYTQGVFCLRKQAEEAICVGVGLFWDNENKSVTPDSSNKKLFVGVSTRGAHPDDENIIVHLQTGPCQTEICKEAQLPVEGMMESPAADALVQDQIAARSKKTDLKPKL